FFTKENFGWSPSMVGLSLAAFGVAIAVVQGGLIRVALRYLGERGTILYGLLFNLGAFIFLALVANGWIALAFIPMTALGAVVTPALQGMMSQRVGDDQQGELQGAITSARALAAILSPLAMTQIFWVFTAGPGPYLPGAPFVLSALLMVVCLALLLIPRQGATKAT
ncbi:MAG: tetracycline resistance MFS efflux pump, partial [Rubellimicrobium sp.]|nr:tetracycline resistance MFS efflux pump [Rubellimicrobium sp.]